MNVLTQDRIQSAVAPVAGDRAVTLDLIGTAPKLRLPPTPRHDSLDGLRAVAVGMVMAVHAGVPGAEVGWLGVDIFFVLSGFLITTLLVEEHRRARTIDLVKFWGRRFCRLMPAYWLYVGALTIVMILEPAAHLRPHGGWTPKSYIVSLWGYFVNYAPLGGIWTHQHLTLHLWSLAVEEQFYFLWPVLAWFVLRLRRPWLIGWGIVAGILVSRMLAPPASLTHLLNTRGLGIVMGCAAALTLASGPTCWLRRYAMNPRVRAAWITGCIGLFFCVMGLVRCGRLTEGQVHRFFVPAFCAFFVGVVIILRYEPQSWLSRLLSARPLVYLGRISYGIYLYHLLAQVLVWQVLLPSMSRWSGYARYSLRLTLYAALTVAIASLSYHFVERPFLRLKERLR